MDWYHTSGAQRLYQNRSYRHYTGEMQALVASMMEPDKFAEEGA